MNPVRRAWQWRRTILERRTTADVAKFAVIALLVLLAAVLATVL